MNNNMKGSLVSLFSGAGGMDLGFEKAGFKTIWANEYDKQIAPSFANYFKNTVVDTRSITQIENKDIPKNVCGLIGGPPCQSWSEAGARRGINDSRGQLFLEYLRVLEWCRPKFFVAENVHGLIHSRNRESFNNLISLFENKGYNIHWKLLTASDYGVPQDRERVIILGFRHGYGKEYKFPSPITPKISLREAIGDLKNKKIGGKIKNHELLESGYSSMFLSRNRVRSWDEQSFTILATDRHIPFHPQAPKMIKKGVDKYELDKTQIEKYRRLTIRECARIQTFPDNYEFLYKHPRTGYKMVGNAVPVNLAFEIAKSIKKTIR